MPNAPRSVAEMLAAVNAAGTALQAAAAQLAAVRAMLAVPPAGPTSPPDAEAAVVGVVAVEITSIGAAPLPVGVVGTTTIFNDTDAAVILKVGEGYPAFAAPGSVAIEIPPAQSAGVAKLPSATELTIDVVKYTYFDPCAQPAQPGVINICFEPVVITRIVQDGDAVPAGSDWPATFTVQKKPDGTLSLTGGS